MNIQANIHAYQATQVQRKDKSEEVEAIKEAHKESQAKQFTQLMSEVQSFVSVKVEKNDVEARHEEFQDFLKGIGYEGPSIALLSEEEAAELVSEDGFFGVTQTSERIANFVISGANGDEELLREGRKGILQGLKDAEEVWGGKLPDISYETIDKAVAMVDAVLVENGFSILSETV